MRSPHKAALTLLAVAVWCRGAGTAGYAECGSCHRAETYGHTHSRMAAAMVPVASSAFALNAGGLLLHEAGNGYQFVYRKTDDGLNVESFKGKDAATAQVRWVLGAGAQGQTPVLQSGTQFFESRVSFFPQLRQFGITVGQTAEPSVSALASLGRPKTPNELAQCLGCHSTVVDAQFTNVLPGVRCERCHAGAAEHARSKIAVVNPGKLSAAQQVHLCGACHRDAPPVDDFQIENVRFQPLRLMKSRCFQQGNIECTTCHSAHQDARRADASFYNSKCLGCHANQQHPANLKADSGCIACHMPQIQLHPALRFTDHFIRIVKASDYPAGSIVQRKGD